MDEAGWDVDDDGRWTYGTPGIPREPRYESTRRCAWCGEWAFVTATSPHCAWCKENRPWRWRATAPGADQSTQPRVEPQEGGVEIVADPDGAGGSSEKSDGPP